MIKLILLIFIICFTFVANASHTNVSVPAPEKSIFQLQGDSIDSVHAAMKEGKISCVQLVKAYLVRIKTYDLSLSRGAPINAFVALNPNIMSEATSLDQYYQRRGHFKGPLHCIPIVVKDNIDTEDSPSTSGSLSMLGSQPTSNAFLVQKIRDAGGIIIGKGSMDEFASGMSGISSKSGRVGNAIDPNQNPGGSSAGVAAAVAANFAVAGIGTDNSGSVRIPAAFNGVDGIRPSTGLISNSGIFPRENSDGVAGVIARNIKDLAITLSVIAKTPNPNDSKTLTIPHRVLTYMPYLNSNAFKGKRIGVITSVGGKKTFDMNNQPVMKIFKQTFAKLRKLGAILINIQLPKFNSDRQYNAAGEVEDINHYLSSFPSTRQTFRDICTSDRTQTFGGVKGCLDHIQDTPPKNGTRYKGVLAMFAKNLTYVRGIMQKHQLTAMLMPLNAEGGPSYDIKRVNTWRAAVSSNSGLPAITIIGGYTHSKLAMPVGLELIGRMYGEAKLISLAYAYEIHYPKHPFPKLPLPHKLSVLSPMSIPQINNFWTVIGSNSYNQFLKQAKEQMITPEQFAELVRNQKATLLKNKALMHKHV